ncbi:hypothetical protein UY3_04783 [Chelonia mydas]|uniref:Uncharacterized protein n=1 Tax=Chelonia mydas TaxID=8469 RepID=M7BLC5_CHEMY|nr:hypothetical protein UY3_04783 [Chelonia mydas]
MPGNSSFSGPSSCSIMNPSGVFGGSENTAKMSTTDSRQLCPFPDIACKYKKEKFFKSADANRWYWPPEANPECSIVTALDSTLNFDALARYTGKAPGTFEFHFLFGQRGELSSTGDHAMQPPQNRKQAPARTERETLDRIAVWGEESVQAELR